MDNPGYEFTESQNGLIRDLAGKMSIYATLMIVVGALALLGGVIAIAKGGAVAAVQGITNCVIGFLTMQAGKSFRLIVDTEGNDIENLMGALGELRKLYTFLILLVILAFVGGFIIGLVGALAQR